MALIMKSFCLPSSVLEDSPGKLFTQLRSGVQSLRDAKAIPMNSVLIDIGFLRRKNNLHITLYFEDSKKQC